jgi:hypothetical protein
MSRHVSGCGGELRKEAAEDNVRALEAQLANEPERIAGPI